MEDRVFGGYHSAKLRYIDKRLRLNQTNQPDQAAQEGVGVCGDQSPFKSAVLFFFLFQKAA